MAYDKDYDKYDEWKKKQEKPWNRFVRNLEPKHYIIIILLIGLMFFLIKDQKTTDRNTILIVGGMAIAIILFLFLKAGESKLITKSQAMIIVKEAFKSEVGHAYPVGTEPELTGYCNLREKEDGSYWRWEVGINMRYPDGKLQEMMTTLHPYTGDILKVMETPAGWNATEVPDMKPFYPFDYYREPGGSYMEE